ncbi:uncharacterized protein Nmlp_2939 [Natronomonas moolapensis 8.8.11]|uniref:Zinc-ribbon domain-containing protein n=1 Tax=Natronomonas moolapensis (strain DSM 18674 / CECT 7526 / JCM 14361 / 8.8.11) TaxID=268739 RepID=M1XL50_NATM8|nr:zinc-ribbon domain-containing protein [Natronomonas moolapensis]CCQ37086.1 uncharacterized protein Nmlp_2939 [Natronomonas moolapensis 8.8.11]
MGNTNSKSGVGYWLKPLITGVIVTKIAYLIPVVNLFAPIVGGSVTAYMLDSGAIEGLKGGFLKGILMTLPAIILGVFFADILAGIPIIGNLLAGSLGLVVAVILLHSVVLGMLSGFVTGAIATTAKEADPVETTAKKTAAAANTADKAKETYSESRKEAKETYSESRDADLGEQSASGSNNVTESRTSNSLDSEAHTGTDQQPKQASDSVSEKQEQLSNCTDCGTDVSPDANFCPECGAESPFSSDGRQSSQYTDSASQSNATQSKENHRQTVSTTATSESDVVRRTVEKIEDQKHINSQAANQLCEALSDPNNSDHVESALDEAIDRLEVVESTEEAITGINDYSSTRQLESAQRQLVQTDSNFADSINSVIDRMIKLENDVDQRAQEHDRLTDAADTICRVAEDSNAVTLHARGTVDRTQQLAEKLDSETMQINESRSSVSTLAEDIRHSIQPETDQSRKLLETLINPEGRDVKEILKTTVKTVDEHAETRQMLSEIGTKDVKRRLDSLSQELGNKDTSIYSHLSDRIRELEALLDDPDCVGSIQLYAIYQEVLYYDRTLLPRLSRSLSRGGSVDAEEMFSTVQWQIEDLKSEFVSVRPDHNHSIPKHFLGLAEELTTDAEKELTDRPERAAGILLAADALIDHVKALYQRNEYSVMLRRLRG